MRAFAWKPRWATIRLVNSCAEVDVGRLERTGDEGAERRRRPAVVRVAGRSSASATYVELPAFSRPSGFDERREREPRERPGRPVAERPDEGAVACRS